MVDYTRPIRLSNGAEAEVVRLLNNGEADVRIKGPYARGRGNYQPDRWYQWGYNKHGDWAGGNRETHFYLENVDMAHELINEEW